MWRRKVRKKGIVKMDTGSQPHIVQVCERRQHSFNCQGRLGRLPYLRACWCWPGLPGSAGLSVGASLSRPWTALCLEGCWQKSVVSNRNQDSTRKTFHLRLSLKRLAYTKISPYISDTGLVPVLWASQYRLKLEQEHDQKQNLDVSKRFWLL